MYHVILYCIISFHDYTLFRKYDFHFQYVCHMKTNLKYSYKKMWYIAVLVRGLSIDDALNQLKFIHRKGALMVSETLEEARDLAVKKHGVEYPSNLWVGE